MAYIHTCIGGPMIKIYINTINNSLLPTFLGLTVEVVKQHLPKNTNYHGALELNEKKRTVNTKNTSTMIMEKNVETTVLESPEND